MLRVPYRISAGHFLFSGLVLGAALGFAIGSRLTGTGSTAPAQASSSAVVDVLPDAVSQRLRDAYYGAGGAIEVCVAAATVVCTRTTSIAQTARHFDDITRSIDAVELAALTAVHVPVGRIIVAGDFGPVDGAAFARIAAGGPVDGRLLMAVNPGRRGIDYLILVSSGSART